MSDDKQKFNELKAEVLKLKEELNKINAEKESYFSEKESLNKKIAELIRTVKEKKGKRDEITSEVKLTKDKRTELETDLRTKIEEIKELNKQRRDAISKNGMKRNPDAVKREIEALERRIETDVMSFDKEKELMKVIKSKKKELADIGKGSEVFDKHRKLSNEIDEIKKVLNIETKSQKKKAKMSQEEHEEMIKLSKEIDELKKKEKEAFDKFIEFKNKFSTANEGLKKKLEELNSIAHKVGEKKEEIEKEKKKKKEVDLKKVQEQISEKIKRGGKLTTEDLIAFQGEQ